MKDERTSSSREAVKAAKKARAVEQAAAAFERDWAEFERLAAKLDVPLDAAAATQAKSEAPPEPQKNENQGFDGSMTSLIAGYKSHPDSGYQKLGYQTRVSYDGLLRRVEREFGPEQVGNVDAERLLHAHTGWTADGTVAMGHSLIGMMRRLATFGSTILKDRACRELRVTLHDMKFPVVRRKKGHLTAVQANAVRAKAHEMKLPSIALAQAFQFECGLGQKDVIGEWVPISEQPPSGVINGKMKWLGGIRWSDIDNLILRLTISTGKNIQIDLRHMPMVMAELARREPGGVPVVVYEKDGLPYQAYTFRRLWRLVANAAGIPKTVMNMDSAGTGQNSPVVEAARKDTDRRR